MASEDNDASVVVRSKVDLSKGHTYGPFRGRIRPLPEDGELPFGAWKIFNGADQPKQTFESNDASLPNWLRFIKSTEDESQQNVTLVEKGKKFFFEVTRDMPKGEEYFVMGRRVEEPPPPPEKKPPIPGQKKRGPGRPKKTSEEQIQKALKDALAQTVDSARGRSRKCTLCGKVFNSSILFMQHRHECAVIKEEPESEEDEEEDEEDEEEELLDEELDEGENSNSNSIKEEGQEGGEEETSCTTNEGKDTPSTSNAQSAPAPAPVKRSWPSGFKRPAGRPRKDGRPPIPRKKRRGRRKRKRVDDDEDFPGRSIKIQKDECILTVEDAEKFPFKCDVCVKVFATKTWHDFHREQHDVPLLTYLVCALCDDAFKFLTDYTAHMELSHPELGKRERVLSNKFRCDACKKSFRSPIHLERHRRRAASEEPLPKGPVQVKCKYCEKSFSMEQGLMNHTIRYHTEHRRFQCTANDCLESFDEKDERAEHLEVAHKLDPRHIYKCPVDLCDKAYTTMSALNYHYELAHTTTSRPFSCELCGKAWVKIGKLREHLKTHSTEKNELCDECGRAFKSRPELKDHKLEMHTETGKEKLNCRYCSATFSRRSSRSYHERRHRNDAPYICPKPGCHKRFIAVIDYKRHLIFHTGAKLYRCRYCSNCFTRSDYLKGHEKKHHAKGEMTDVGPPIEETVTIKVPWPMEKAVKIQGQNVVVIIEPDPTLADATMAADAIAALDSMASVESDTSIQIPVQVSSDRVSEQLVTAVVAGDGDIVQQAAQQAIHESSVNNTQLIQIPTNAAQQAFSSMDTSASVAIQQAVAQAAMAAAAATASTSATEVTTSSVVDTTHQIFLQTSAAGDDGTETTLEVQEAEEVSLEGATSEQAAIKMAIQQLATDGTHVVLQPATAHHTEMGTTMQATLQGEDGQTQIVMVNLAPGTVLTDEDGNVSVTSGVGTDGVITMTTGDADQEVLTMLRRKESHEVAIAAVQMQEVDGQEVAMATDQMQETDSQEVAMATAHIQEADSQEVAIAAAQMQAETEQMNEEAEGEIQQQVTTTVDSTDVTNAVTTISYSDISHTLTTV